MRKRIRGWRALLVALALLAAVVLIDTGLTRAHALWCPKDPQWVVTSLNFPEVYRNFLATDLAKALNDEAPEHYAAWQLAVRQATGIRPTPLRWRVWLGRRFLVAVSDDGWGACVRPGLLLRAADFLRGLGRWRPLVRQFGPYYYAWRDGALIFSKSEKYVLDCLDAEPFTPPGGAWHDDDLWVYETREGRSAAAVRPAGQIYVNGWINNGFTTYKHAPLTLAAWPPDAAVAWAAAIEFDDLHRVGTFLWGEIDRHAEISALPWFKPLKEYAEKAVATGRTGWRRRRSRQWRG
ncbi:MAG: hypothetical protein NTZ09_16780 [Candidatus Hydrogenedentes bacterium]|nr:hypothetical protein [Candidatus Hydrogenedentota bacterium]